MRESLAELWRYRELLRQLVRRAIKIRYKNSALGFFWSVIPPVLELLIYSFLIQAVLANTVKNYGAYLLCGLIPWNFLQNAVLDSSQSLLTDYSIIKKVYMPREVIPLGYVLSNFIHFVLAWGVYFIGFYVVLRLIPGYGTPLLPTMLAFPFITAILFLFATGLSLWASALNVFYEDVKFIIQTLFRLVFFLLPIIYPVERIGMLPIMQANSWMFRLYSLNPITAIITAYRKTLLQPMPAESFNVPHFAGMQADNWLNLFGAALISLLIATSGYAYFNRRKWQFVERS